MPETDLNIIVCIDPRQCLHQRIHGYAGAELLQGLQDAVAERGLKDAVQVTPCYCIFGCTYGPRIDVSRRWSGEKILYGSIDGEAGITRRGRVQFTKIPKDLTKIVLDNLPPQ